MAAAQADESLVPAPRYYQGATGTLTLNSQDRIAVEGGEPAFEQSTWIANLVHAQAGLTLEVVPGREGRIRVAAPDPEKLGRQFEEAGLPRPPRPNESYRLVIGEDGVLLESGGDAGRLYGLVTLWQLLVPATGPAGSLRAAQIYDAPAFAWRGLMLDSARHMQSVGFIRSFIDWMALHKLNVLHWHLTDDQAWRLEIKAYPRLAEVGGYRVPAGRAPEKDIDPQTGQPRLYGGYYTQDQVRDLVAYAARRNITVVPEIDVPGHVTAAIVAYPALGVAGFWPERVPADWGIFDNTLNLEESTFEFLKNVLAEVVALFPSPYVHLGGDEVSTVQWEASDRIAERMQELGIDSLQGVQNYYVERLNAWLEKHGRQVMGWDEILESDLPANAAIMSWRGVAGAIEAAKKGHQAVLSPSPTLYFDHLQTSAADAPPGRGGVITMRDVYDLDILPQSLADNREYVLGVQANLWTEHIRTEDRVAYMAWPRAAAVAELGWTEPEARDWERFKTRLPDLLARLERLGVPAAQDPQALYGQVSPAASATRREDRELELCSHAIELALEDDAPLDGQRESYLLDIMNPCWIWRDADLAGVRSVSASVGQLPFNFQIGAMVNDVVVEAPETRDGELQVKLGGCEGPVVARLPLAPAVSNDAATELAPAAIGSGDPLPERADLCFSFARSGIDPIWALDWVSLEQETP